MWAMKLSISSALLDQMQAQAQHGAPLEICGLLFGENSEVSDFQLTRNVATKAHRHFEIDPADLISAEREARDGGPEILGYYHSHPSGQVEPSETDAKNAAADDRIWLILNGVEAAAWKTSKDGEIFGRFDPILLECNNG